MLDFCDFIQVYVFTTNHHLKHCFASFKFLHQILKEELRRHEHGKWSNYICHSRGYNFAK